MTVGQRQPRSERLQDHGKRTHATIWCSSRDHHCRVGGSSWIRRTRRRPAPCMRLCGLRAQWRRFTKARRTDARCWRRSRCGRAGPQTSCRIALSSTRNRHIRDPTRDVARCARSPGYSHKQPLVLPMHVPVTRHALVGHRHRMRPSRCDRKITVIPLLPITFTRISNPSEVMPPAHVHHR